MSWVSEVGKCAQAWHAFERLDPQQGLGLGVRQRGKVVIGGTREIQSPKRRSMAPVRGGPLGTTYYNRLFANLYHIQYIG